jgi:hypothetical protein
MTAPSDNIHQGVEYNEKSAIADAPSSEDPVSDSDAGPSSTVTRARQSLSDLVTIVSIKNSICND